LLMTWHTGPEVRSTANRMEPWPQPDEAAVAKLPHRSQDELLDAIRHSIYTQPPTDWSTVTNLGVMRAVPEVKETVNLAQQYVDLRYDPQAFIARLAEIVCHDNFTEMHAFMHHQSIVEEFHATREPWRWMHLVCGAQAAAISFGKNMTIYEEYLELLHAALAPARQTGRPCASLFAHLGRRQRRTRSLWRLENDFNESGTASIAPAVPGCSIGRTPERR